MEHLKVDSGCTVIDTAMLISLYIADNARLQDDVLQFINTVLILDHPKLCKPLRTNILAIKVFGVDV